MFLRALWLRGLGFRIWIMVSSEETLSKGLLTAQQMREKLALAEAQKAGEASVNVLPPKPRRRRLSTNSQNHLTLRKRNGLNVPRPSWSGLWRMA